MSYRNPKQFVDNQSAANARRASDGINKGVQSFIAGYTKNKLENEKILKDTLKWEMEMRNKVASAEGELGMSSPGMTMSMRSQLNESIRRAAQLRQKSILTEEEKVELQNIMQVPDTILKFANNMSVYGSNVTNQLKTQGNFGGIDPTAETGITRAMLGISGNSAIQGVSTFQLDLTNPMGPSVSVNFKEEGSNQAMTIDGFELEKRIQGNNPNLLPIIRDESSNMQKMMNTVFYGNEKGEGKIDSEFYKDQEFKVVKDVRYTDGTLKGQIREQKPNKQLIEDRSRSIIDSKINNTTVSNSDKIGWYNMFQTSLYGENAEQLEHTDLITEEQTEKLAKDYGEYALRTYGQFATITDTVSAPPKTKNSNNSSTFVGYNNDSNLSVEQVDGIVDDYVGNLQDYITQGNAKIFDDKLDVNNKKIVEAKFENGILKYKLELGKNEYSEEYEKDPNDLEDLREMLSITIDKNSYGNNINKRDITQALRIKTKDIFTENQKLRNIQAQKQQQEQLILEAKNIQAEKERKKVQLIKDQEEWDRYQNMTGRDFKSPKQQRRYHKVFGYAGRNGKDLKPRPTRYEDLNT